MQIILFREKRGRVGSQGISGGVLATIAAVVLAGLLGDAYLLARYFDQDLLDAQVVAAWRDRLSGQQADVDRIFQHASDLRAAPQHGAVGARVQVLS